MCNANLLAYNDFNINVESTYSVQAYGIHADFSLGTRVFQEIEEALQGYEIGILGIEIVIAPWLNTHIIQTHMLSV